MIIHILISKVKKLTLYIERAFDYFYRELTGLPSIKRSEITPQLFIGGQYSLRALNLFQKLGITAIVNMRTKSRYTKKQISPLHQMHLPTRDLSAPTIQNLQKGVDFITHEIKNGGKVYIHCRLGHGRGPTMGSAYLISIGLTTDDAIELIRRNRPFIMLTQSQKKRLQEFETLMHTS